IFQPATLIHTYLASSCRSGLDAVNCASTQSEMPNVSRDVTNATQRMAFFCSEFRKRITSTPKSGKEVRRVRGCKRNSMFYPQVQNRRRSKVEGQTFDFRPWIT